MGYLGSFGLCGAGFLACIASFASAQQSGPLIAGGGSVTDATEYVAEFSSYNARVAASAAMFGNPGAQDQLFLSVGSVAGQNALLSDGACNPGFPCTGGPVDYAASEPTFTSAQIGQWQSSSVGATQAGHLIQLPSMALGVAIPVVNAKITANGASTGGSKQPPAGGVAFTDDDLCGIFSGKLTNWSQTTAAARLAPGQITVVYQSGQADATLLLVTHLSAVCTAGNSSFTLPLAITNVFTNVFTTSGGTVPSNFTGQSGSSGAASYLANATGMSGAPTVTSAIGYVTPDYTTVDPDSSAVLANGTKSPLVVAALFTGGTAYIPDVSDLALATRNVSSGAHLTPPASSAQGSNPANYVPVITAVSKGYPIVAYTTFDTAQCYANAAVATGLIDYLGMHYSSTSYKTTMADNGFVALLQTGAAPFLKVIQRDILSNADKWNDNIQNATICKNLPGR